ncbi:sodium:solute symporter family protein [Natrialba taiwanensis]|uniref:Na+/solute symporter n=1 Tax=Natrialba taiwanensis DSM 12281 TaxID=1230458 RepID=L9ZJA0_9EURY|nr:sodium:solute symporter family protein [Natrialba taiwanensis]ELY86439.1 Na+/solute symporter [Natrialba taiwanensis DSM 12281]
MVSTATLIITVIPLAYLVFALWVGVRSRSAADQSTTEGFVAGDRRIGVLVLFFIMSAANNSAFAFLGGPGFAFDRGAAGFYIITYSAFGFALWYVFGPKVSRLGRKLGYVTQAEFVSDRFDSKWISAIMAIASVTAFIPYLVVQIKGVAFILNEASNGIIPFWLSGLLPFLVIGIYVVTSGMMGVGWSNVLQGIMMVLLAWFLGLYLPFELHGGVEPMFKNIAASDPSHLLVGLPEMSMLQYSSFIVVSALGSIMWPHLFMRAYTADDTATVKKTAAFYPLFQFIIIPILLIGFAGVTVVEPSLLDSPDRILPYLVMSLDMNPLLIGLFFAGALAATMSTADAIVHSSVSVIMRDFYKPLFDPEGEKVNDTFWMKVLVFPTLGVAYYFAMFSSINIVPLQAAAYGAIIQFIPLVVGAMYWPRATKTGALSGLFAGTVVTGIFTFVVPTPLTVHAGFWGLLVTTAVFVIVSLMTKVENPEFAREIIRETRPKLFPTEIGSEDPSVAATDGGTLSDDTEK